MRNRELHDALRKFAVEAAGLLSQALESGHELSFEVAEQRGGGPTLYRYRPLTSEFIDERWDALRALPSCPPATEALGSGARAWLRVQAMSGDETEPALRAMLDRLYDDASSFEFPEPRFDLVYEELERTLYEGMLRTQVVVPLHGVRIASERADLGDGLSLVSAASPAAPEQALWGPGGTGPAVLCCFEREIAPEEPLPLAEAAQRFGSLIGVLRLFKAGPVAPGGPGWVRVDDGPWQPVGIVIDSVAAELRQVLGRLRPPWSLAEGEEAELRDFIGAVSRSVHGRQVGWALERFQTGAARALGIGALSDHLLALRALLDGGDDTGRASLSLRLAALCADEGDRRAVQRRVEMAFSLERYVTGGGNPAEYLEAMGSETPEQVVLEIEEHLRALLRDVLCGYLEQDLKTLADDTLLASSEPLDIRARDLRRAPPAPEPEPVGARRQVGEAQTEELEAIVEPEPAPERFARPAPAERAEAGPEDAVTPSADWGFDEDASSYSAPV